VQPRRRNRRRHPVFNGIAWALIGGAVVTGIAWSTRYRPPSNPAASVTASSTVAPSSGTTTSTTDITVSTAPSSSGISAAPSGTAAAPPSNSIAVAPSSSMTLSLTCQQPPQTMEVYYPSGLVDALQTRCATDPTYTWAGTEGLTARCLYINGVGAQAALDDATNPEVQGTLLSLCEADPQYRVSPAASQTTIPPTPSASQTMASQTASFPYNPPPTPMASQTMASQTTIPPIPSASQTTTFPSTPPATTSGNQACFVMDTTQLCGQTSNDETLALPPNLMNVMGACSDRLLISPVGCLVAEGSAAMNAPYGNAPRGSYYAWLETGELFTCPVGAAPTRASGCTYLYTTLRGTGWNMSSQFDYAKAPPTPTCPPALDGTETYGRVMVTLGIETPGGGYKPIPGVIVDTGAPYTYLDQSDFSGTAVTAGDLGSQVFGLFRDQPAVGGRWYTVPMAILDGNTWAPLGSPQVFGMNPQQVEQTGVPNGLGLNALMRTQLSYEGSSWTMTFQC